MFKYILNLSAFILSIFAVEQLPTTYPVVGDWDKAINFEGLVRIPMHNPHGHSWYIDMKLGSEQKQKKMRCVVDNNHSLSMVFGKNCDSCPNRGRGYDHKLSKHFFSL